MTAERSRMLGLIPHAYIHWRGISKSPFSVEVDAEPRDFVNDPVDFDYNDVDIDGCEYEDECELEDGGKLLSKMWRAEALKS